METVVKRSESGFFKYVWRFNALAIAGAATVCILLGIYGGLTLYTEETRSRRVPNVVNVGEKDDASEEFSLGDPAIIAGTPYVRIPLDRGQSYSASYKRSTLTAVNYLFLNTSTNESRWLFERARQLIIDSQVLFDKLKKSPDEPRTGVGVVHIVVERDSNGDNQLTYRDAVTLATSAVDGANYRKLIEGVERLYSVQQIADDKVLVLYQKNQQTISELYSVPRMERLMQTNIPKLI